MGLSHNPQTLKNSTEQKTRPHPYYRPPTVINPLSCINTHFSWKNPHLILITTEFVECHSTFSAYFLFKHKFQILFSTDLRKKKKLAMIINNNYLCYSFESFVRWKIETQWNIIIFRSHSFFSIVRILFFSFSFLWNSSFFCWFFRVFEEIGRHWTCLKKADCTLMRFFVEFEEKVDT